MIDTSLLQQHSQDFMKWLVTRLSFNSKPNHIHALFLTAVPQYFKLYIITIHI